MPTDFVLIDLLDGPGSPRHRARAAQFVRAIPADSSTRILRAEPSYREAAIGLFEQRGDKAWSFTDCASFVAVVNEGLDEALTGDTHFEQAGFRALLK